MILTSPDETVHAEVTVDDAGRPTIEIRSAETSVVRPSPLGLRTFDRSFVAGLSIADRERRTIETVYRTPAGKQRNHTYRANESTVTLTTTAGDRIRIDVRVSNDGVAYRYRLPGRGSAIITAEESGFQLPDGVPAWLMPFEKKHEGVWRQTTTADAEGQYSFPTLFEVDGRWVLLTEADVDGRYAAARLSVTDESLFSVRFPDSANHRMETAEQDVSTTLPLATPWRVAIVGDLETVVESNLVTDVIDGPSRGGDPCQIEEDGWIRPGRVAWSWWSDGASPSDFEAQQAYVDYASDRGWEYVLVDVGWSEQWVPDLVKYANERDVGILLWSRWSDLDTEAKRETRLSRWAAWGVDGVKVDYMNADTQEMMQFYDELAAATADRQLLLNVHGSVTPKGLRRRWPHLLTYEGVFGAENYHPVPNTIPPTHNVILPFTRNALGPMDYTPVTFSAETRRTSAGHELALSVVYETGLQHFADDVQHYAARPLAERFLERVPAAWDETTFLGGYPGEEATLARRDGERWFVGSITAGEGRKVEVPCSFLEADRSYAVTVYRDRSDENALACDEFVTTSDEAFAMSVPENGGFCAVFDPESDPAEEFDTPR